MLIFQSRACGEYSRPLLLPRRQQATPPPLSRLSHSVGPGEVFCGGGLCGLGSERPGRGSQTGTHRTRCAHSQSCPLHFPSVPPEDMQLFPKRICAGSLNEVDPAEMPAPAPPPPQPLRSWNCCCSTAMRNRSLSIRVSCCSRGCSAWRPAGLN